VLKRLEDLVQRQPQNPGLRMLLATAQARAKDLQKAELNVKEALKLDPKTPGAHFLLAGILEAKGLPDQSKAELRAAMEAEPRNLSSYLVLENQYEKDGRWDEAKKIIQKARQIDPESPILANQLAYLYLEHGGDANVALNLAQQAKQKLPNSPNIADTLGWAFYKRGMTEPAIAQLQECVKTFPTHGTCHYHLGMAYIAAHNVGAAEQSLRLALKDPNFQDAEAAKTALAKISSSRR
jgi:tetratricopeptide (TPR) repeat protein